MQDGNVGVYLRKSKLREQHPNRETVKSRRTPTLPERLRPRGCSFLTAREGARWVPMHAKCGQMHVHLYVHRSVSSRGERTRTYARRVAQRDPRIRTHARRAPVVTAGTLSTMPIITYRPRGIPLLADSSRCCPIHATPRSTAVF